MHPQRGLFFIFILFNSFIWAQPQVKEYNCQGEKLIMEKNRTGLYRLDKRAMKEITRCNPDTKTVVFFFPIWCAPCHEHFNYLMNNIDLQKYTLLITSIEKEQSNRATHFFNAFYKPKKQNKKMFPYPVFILSDEYLSGVVLRSKNKAENFLVEYNSEHKNAQTNGNVAIFSEDNELIYFGSFEDYLINWLSYVVDMVCGLALNDLNVENVEENLKDGKDYTKFHLKKLADSTDFNLTDSTTAILIYSKKMDYVIQDYFKVLEKFSGQGVDYVIITFDNEITSQIPGA